MCVLCIYRVMKNDGQLGAESVMLGLRLSWLAMAESCTRHLSFVLVLGIGRFMMLF